MPDHPTFPRDLSAIPTIGFELARRPSLSELLGRSLPAWLDDLVAFERFMTHILCRPPAECWEWTATVNRYGHAQVTLAGKTHGAHRIAYQWLVGPIPDSLVIDHLCRNRACVNPSHLEPVTAEENVMRGYGAPAIHARKTHCPQGHPYDETNTILLTDGGRRCRTCAEGYYATNQDRLRPKRNAAYAARRVAEGKEVLPPPAARTHCKRGHEYTPENTRTTSNGYRQCRACARIIDQQRYANDPDRKAEVKANAAASKARIKGTR
jgi:hypothetical protein